MDKFLSRVAAVWVITLGAGLIFVPGQGIQCIVCGDRFNLLIGVASVVLGAAALVSGLKKNVLV